MPTPGYVFRDGGPIPDSDLQESVSPAAQQPSTSGSSRVNTPTSSISAITSNTPTEGHTTFASAPTDSHALAAADHEEKGAAQQVHSDVEVRDLGWSEHPQDIPMPLVGGLRNEELWLLVRRFDKQLYHVKATPIPPLGGLDLNAAEEDEFSPDKLRASLERLYMTVIVGMVAFGKHIARLRSWREPRRTAGFCAAYFIAWILNLIMPSMLLTLIVLIVYPPSRSFLFPPAPIALVNSKTGGIQSPKAGVLGSHDSITGAPEKHKGEAVEKEASNFVSGFASIALSSAIGKHDQENPESDSIGSSVPDPTAMATSGADAKAASGGGIPTTKHDKTKQPMEDAMWSKMRPIMHVVNDVADGWERFANALQPTPPFPRDKYRIRLASLLVPGVAIAALTTSDVFMKMTTFFVGFGFFADPIIWRAAHYLNEKFPNWQKLLELRNNILKGVPTNAQLTLTLLRIGEANRAPIPPPPTSDQPPPSRPASLHGDDLSLDATHEEIHDAIHADPTVAPAPDGSGEKPKKHHGSRVLNFFKGTTKSGVETKLGIDKVRAAVGSEHARNHLGVLPKPDEQTPSGPIDFKCRCKGKKGWVYVSTTGTMPCVSFSTKASDGTGLQSAEELNPVFSIPIEDIRELKKIGGLGWKAKIVVGWATDRNVADGLEIVDAAGNPWKLLAMPMRDELFNRLIAMGGQKWESW